MHSQLTSTFLKRLEKHLTGWHTTLRFAAAFRSAATGHMKLDSDIDLFLVRAADSGHDVDDQWKEQVTELARPVTEWTCNDGRIVEYAEDEFRAAASASEPLLRDVAKQALTAAGTRSWLNAQLRPAAKRP